VKDAVNRQSISEYALVRRRATKRGECIGETSSNCPLSNIIGSNSPMFVIRVSRLGILRPAGFIADATSHQNQSNFFSTISKPAVVITISPAAISVACGESIHGRSFMFIPKKPEITIAGRAIVPSTVSTFIT
jgi:hypothetical protein